MGAVYDENVVDMCLVCVRAALVAEVVDVGIRPCAWHMALVVPCRPWLSSWSEWIVPADVDATLVLP